MASDRNVVTLAVPEPGKVTSAPRAVSQAVNAAGSQLLNGFVVAALLLSGCWVLAKSVTVSGHVISDRRVEAVAGPVMGPQPQVPQPMVNQPVVNQPVLAASVCEPPAQVSVVAPPGEISILRGGALAADMSSSSAVPGGLSSLSAAAVRDGIEDLLRNQVPVESSAVRLPAGVQIYGRPNRPQVLRLDAPHVAVSGPHFPAGVRQVRGSESGEVSLRGAVREALQESAGETVAEQRLARLTRTGRGAGGVPRG
jgi:hypothetical protein